MHAVESQLRATLLRGAAMPVTTDHPSRSDPAGNPGSNPSNAALATTPSWYSTC